MLSSLDRRQLLGACRCNRKSSSPVGDLHRRSLVALLAAAPAAAAAALLPEFRSPHLDIHQRLLVGSSWPYFCSTLKFKSSRSRS
jgi:hypothetical protein